MESEDVFDVRLIWNYSYCLQATKMKARSNSSVSFILQLKVMHLSQNLSLSFIFGQFSVFEMFLHLC